MTGENDPVEDLTDASTPSVAVVTGASSGIGLAAAKELARRGWAVTIVGRDPQRLAEATDAIRAVARTEVVAHQCDFERLDDVRALAARLKADHPRIDLLANNAGGVIRARATTVDGHERTIQSNHLAGFLLSHELRENLRDGRIVNTSSAAHAQGRLDPDDLNGDRQTYGALVRYGAAKQANILFAAEAARQWPDILSTSYHPGVVRTRFGSDSALYRVFYKFAPGLRTVEKGAETLVWLATSERDAIVNGGYYVDGKLGSPARRALDATTAARLWKVSLDAVAR